MFANRTQAGQQLAPLLEHLRDEDIVVVGLPRGGVPVALQVARALGAPLDVILVRKLGVPFQPELAMGAIGEGGVRVADDRVIRMTGVSADQVEAVEARERTELDRRAKRYRAGRERIILEGRQVVVIDDGIATGSTARAACQVARRHGASRIILAVPVAPSDWTDRLSRAADELISLSTPKFFFGIGQFYRDFSPTSDEEVIGCLDQAARSTSAALHERDNPGDDPPAGDEDVEMATGSVTLRGHLTVPENPRGIVIFAHGAGSSRHSPRNRYVASVLNEAGLATLLFDLLTETEEVDRANVFDIELLGQRLVDVTGWVGNQPRLGSLDIGYFGASTGAAAALWAAAEPSTRVRAVVSRGGRPDLAGLRLSTVRSPTLLIVGAHDHVVLDLNEEAAAQLQCPTELEIVPGATHLFEEPGTLQVAAATARDWFLNHLSGDSSTMSRS